MCSLLSSFTASDVWSFGVVLSEVFSQGSVPYPELTEEETVQRIKAGYRMPKPLDCPSEVYDIMLTCWRMDPSERPTMKELCAHLDQLEQRAAAGELGPKPVSVFAQKPPAVKGAPMYVGANAPSTTSTTVASSFATSAASSQPASSSSAPVYVGSPKPPAASASYVAYAPALEMRMAAAPPKAAAKQATYIEECTDQRGYFVTP